MPIEAGDAVVTISGESADLDAELEKVDAEVQQTCDGITENFTAAGAAVAGFGAAITALLGLAVSASAAEEAMTTRLIVALRNIGIEYDSVRESLEATIDSMQQMTSFADTDMRESLSILVLATGDLDEAMDLLNLAMDMAVGMGSDLVNSTSRLGMALAGNWGMLQRYVPVLAQCSTEEEKWLKLREMFADQAVSYGSILKGQFDLLKNNLGDVAEMIGDVLSPAITWVIEKVNDFIQWIKTLNPFLIKLVTIGLAVSGALALIGGGFILLSALAPKLITLITMLSAMTLPKLLISLKALVVVMWHFVASMLAALASLGPVGWAMLATGVALIAVGVTLAMQHSAKAQREMGEAVDDTTLSLEDSSTALADYEAEIAAASGSMGDLGTTTLATADAQGILASGINSTTASLVMSTSAARGLALALGDIMAYARTFPGGMTMGELAAFSGKSHVEVLTWEEWLKKWGYTEEGPHGLKHGGMLMEPTLLWGTRSRRLLGIAGEAGPEAIGPTLRPGTSIYNSFQIAQLVVREEADVPKIARVLLQMQESKYRAKGISV